MNPSDARNDDNRHLLTSLPLMEIDRKYFEAELIENEQMIRSNAEKSLVGKIWNLNRFKRSHVYSSFKEYMMEPFGPSGRG